MKDKRREPAVSVIVTTFNQARFIGETLGSVFAQTHQASEVIVVNDGSTDDTDLKITPFKNQVRYICQNNQGVAAARNAGIEEARSEWLAFLDGDDLWEREKLAVQVEAIRRYPKAGLVVVDGIQFSGEAILDESLLGLAVREALLNSGAEMLVLDCYKDLLNANLIATTSQVMIPRAVIRKVGLSNSRFPIANDYDLYLRISKRYPTVFVNRRLVKWRYLASSASGPARLRSLKWSEDLIAVRKKHLRTIPLGLRNEVKRWIHRDLTEVTLEAYYYGHSTDRKWATRYLFRLLSRNPGSISILAYIIALWSPTALINAVSSVARRTGTQ